MGITYRSEKGSPLTIEELDNNFRHFTGSQSITGSLTVSGSVTTVEASGSLGSNEQPWRDLFISNDSLVISDGRVSASISYPLNILGTSLPNTGSYNSSYLDNGGGMTLQFSGSIEYYAATGSITGSGLYKIETEAPQANPNSSQGYSKYIFSKRDINNYSYSTGSKHLYGIITGSVRESDSFLVRLYTDELPNQSVLYTNSGSAELVNIDPITGEGDLQVYLKAIGGYGVGLDNISFPTYIFGNVTNASFQVSKTAPFTYTNSGSFLISGSVSGSNLVFNKLDGTNFSLDLSGSGNLYDNDGSLSSNRTVDLNSNNLTFTANAGEDFNINLDNGANVKIPNLLASSSNYVLGYNTSTGQISYLSTSSLTSTGAYTYVPSYGDTSKQISGSSTLILSSSDSVSGGVNFPTVASNEITIQQNGVYKIEYNAMISGSTSGTSNSWWSVQLKLNQSGDISYPASNYAVKANLEPYYGSVHLLYVGSLNANDVISFIGNTTDSSIDYLRGRAFVRKIS